MTRRGTQEARKHRIIIGAVVSVATFGFALPITFSLLCRWLDQTFNFSYLLSQDLANIVAAACVLIGLFWMTWSYSFLVFVGKGSPVEAFGIGLDPTRVMVTSGPYAYLRHPMVFGVLWMLLGIAVYLRSVSGVILAPVCGLIAWVYLVTWEERHLERRFGEDYHRYREHVRALWPHLSPYLPLGAGDQGSGVRGRGSGVAGR